MRYRLGLALALILAALPVTAADENDVIVRGTVVDFGDVPSDAAAVWVTVEVHTLPEAQQLTFICRANTLSQQDYSACATAAKDDCVRLVGWAMGKEAANPFEARTFEASTNCSAP